MAFRFVQLRYLVMVSNDGDLNLSDMKGLGTENDVCNESFVLVFEESKIYQPCHDELTKSW